MTWRRHSFFIFLSSHFNMPTMMTAALTMVSCSQRQLQLLLVFLLIQVSCLYALASLKTPATTTSYVELIEPETKCKVVLLGCLHGSRSSALDVEHLFMENVDAVVLELCASRVADLKRQESVLQSPAPSFSVQNFVKMVARTAEKRGWGSGVAAAVLGGASGLQTALSGFEAGLEFTTALDLAQQQKVDVVLADQTVDETLRKVGNLPSISMSMLFQEKRLPLYESNALTTAILGDDKLRTHQVNMGHVLSRNDAVVQELLKLTLPPLSLAFLAGFTADKLVSTIFSVPTTTQIPWWTLLQDFDVTELWNMVGMDLVSSAFVLMLGYVALALPATRVILCERDDQLTQGIRAACKSASKNKKSNENARVVAVLGLLHVNGVAKRLLQQQENDAAVMDEVL